jgi:hypothetical protein
MNLRTTFSGSRARGTHRRRPPVPVRRPALYVGVAAAGALMVNVLLGADPAAQAESGTSQSVSVAQQLGLTAQSAPAPATSGLQPLQELTASRSTREAQQSAAQQTQAAADQAELDRQKAAADAAAQAAAQQAAAASASAAQQQQQQPPQQAAASSSPAAPGGSFQDYALQKLGGDSSQFSCLENLWGKESKWNPNAQNPSSTAYGIPQFLDSTWAGTGIAKTSDGYRQIDAGLIYIEQRYGSPCGAWGHSRSTGWY